METHVHHTSETLSICEAHIRGACKFGANCIAHHWPLPYLWQVNLEWSGWMSLQLEESEAVEKMFCLPGVDSVVFQTNLPDADGQQVHLDVMVVFADMNFIVRPVGKPNVDTTTLPARRLTTTTFVRAVTDRDSLDDPATPLYCTQWRWYYEDPGKKGTWHAFEEDGKTPMQWTLEDKFDSGQEMYRFEVDVPPRGRDTFMINFLTMKVANPRARVEGDIRRRPQFLSQADRVAKRSLSYPPRKQAPFWEHVPSNWYPVDPRTEYELVPLNPESMEYHLVKSELVKSLPSNRTIYDVFRVQNPFLWHKYNSKKQVLEHKGVVLNELQLFHGTSPESAQAIFRQNFDWRLSGKNKTLYGRGCYFATDASYSDKFTGSPGPGQFRWMFMARVLTGRSTKGRESYVRPPYVDATDPHSDLFESCVDSEHRPSIYVIFDTDQVYPEFVVSYR